MALLSPEMSINSGALEDSNVDITAQLVETRTGHSVWAERYDRALDDVFAIQDEIANNIARALEVILSEDERMALARVPTRDIRAYEYYLRGRQFFHQSRRKGFDFAREMFAQAIQIDPTYARAYAGIADCSSFLYMYWDSTPPNLEQADQASRKTAVTLEASGPGWTVERTSGRAVGAVTVGGTSSPPNFLVVTNATLIVTNGFVLGSGSKRGADAFQHACERGASKGCFWTGQLYEEGKTLPKDLARAAEGDFSAPEMQAARQLIEVQRRWSRL